MSSAAAQGTQATVRDVVSVRVVARWMCLAVAVWAAVFMLGQTLLRWFFGDFAFFLGYPLPWALFLPFLVLVPLLAAVAGLALTRPKRGHVMAMAICVACAVVPVFLWREMYEAGSRFWFLTHREGLERAVMDLRAGNAVSGRWRGEPEMTGDYVAFAMDGFLDNISGVVHVSGEVPQPDDEFMGAQLVVLEPLRDGWYLFHTT
ncbi:MAG TPA: hypothetical protein VF039_08275 [Longimicrobiales bacterium]